MPVVIRSATNRHQIRTHFMIHIKKYPNLKNSEEFWIRSGIRITDIRTLGKRPVRAMVVVEDNPLATFLGDAETPAHTDWKENTEGFKEKYQNAVKVLRFIKKSLSKLVSLLDEPPREVQKDFLKEIFHVPIPPEERQLEDKSTSQEPKIPPTTHRQEVPVNINKIAGGFSITLKKEVKSKLPFSIAIKVAYDIRRGNPFAKYEIHDFNLADLNIDVNGGVIESRERNEMKINIESSDFHLKVTGFDIHRDLVVAVREGKK